MATFRTGAAASGYDIVRQTLLTYCVTALFAFAELPAELDQRDLLSATVTCFFSRCTHILFIDGLILLFICLLLPWLNCCPLVARCCHERSCLIHFFAPCWSRGHRRRGTWSSRQIPAKSLERAQRRHDKWSVRPKPLPLRPCGPKHPETLSGCPQRWHSLLFVRRCRETLYVCQR